MIKYNLQLFADGPGGEKTEEASSKKLEDARKDGQVAKSNDLIVALSLIAIIWFFKFFVFFISENILSTFTEFFGKFELIKQEFNYVIISILMIQMLKIMLIIMIPIFFVGYIVIFISSIFQVKWKVSFKPLEPKLDKFDVVKGFKRILSKDKLFELLKSVIKIFILSYIAYDMLKDEWQVFYKLYDMELISGLVYVMDIVVKVSLKICYYLLIIAIVDFAYQKIKFKKDMMMTKQEVKEEYKQQEGDPQIKGQIKAKMREASRRRMMSSIKDSDVVITNPTHISVAIKYDKDSNKAPIVVAKGEDYLALKIRKKARENNVEIVENKPLARSLYYSVDIGEEIPKEMYQLVAEVLAYVYSKK